MLIFSCFANKLPLQFVALCMNQFIIQLIYFMSVSFLSFGVLKVLKLRNESFRPRNLDFFFTSASATTVSSMSTVEMEVFSDAQLIVLTIMMFMGGEVFTSMVGLLSTWLKLKRLCKAKNTIFNSNNLILLSPSNSVNQNQIKSLTTENLKYTSIKFLSLVVLGYLVVIHVVGVTFVVTYLTCVPSARDVLKRKGLKLFIFSIFTVVSTFANCGFVPTNENMVVFSKNSGLLLILIPQVLLGNTLFPSSLRFSVWILGKFFQKLKSDSNDLLRNRREIGYTPLLPSLHSSLLVVTVVVFILLQFILFCFMNWNLAALSDLNSYQKVVAVLFEAVNSRYSGETILDLSTISAASLVLFIVMMYLPPYTSFLPIGDDEQCSNERESWKKKSRGDAMENLIFSQLSYLVIFIILICITERKMMKEDPLNFSVLNIVLEVISAYGNVGFSTGYSCARQLKHDGNCKDKWYGFSGKWSDKGKIILIVVMFFGRLKKFNMHGGQAWKLQ